MTNLKKHEFILGILSTIQTPIMHFVEVGGNKGQFYDLLLEALPDETDLTYEIAEGPRTDLENTNHKYIDKITKADIVYARTSVQYRESFFEEILETMPKWICLAEHPISPVADYPYKLQQGWRGFHCFDDYYGMFTINEMKSKLEHKYKLIVGPIFSKRYVIDNHEVKGYHMLWERIDE